MSDSLAIAQAAVTQLYAKYMDALHRRAADDWTATWCSYARWELPIGPTPDEPLILEGRDAIVGTWVEVMKTLPMVQHLPLAAPLIDTSSGVIKARWHVREQLIMPDGNGQELLGIYDDVHAEEEGVLRYKDRKFSVLFRRPLSGADLETMTHPGAMS